MDSGTYEAYEPAPTDTGVCAREETAIAERRKIAALKDNRLRFIPYSFTNIVSTLFAGISTVAQYSPICSGKEVASPVFRIFTAICPSAFFVAQTKI